MHRIPHSIASDQGTQFAGEKKFWHESRNQRWKWEWLLSLWHLVPTHRTLAPWPCNFGVFGSEAWFRMEKRFHQVIQRLLQWFGSWDPGSASCGSSPCWTSRRRRAYCTGWSRWLRDVGFLLRKTSFWNPRDSLRYFLTAVRRSKRTWTSIAQGKSYYFIWNFEYISTVYLVTE